MHVIMMPCAFDTLYIQVGFVINLGFFNIDVKLLHVSYQGDGSQAFRVRLAKILASLKLNDQV